MNKTFDIAEGNLDQLTTKLNKLNARLVKIGSQPCTFRVTGHRDEPDSADKNKVHRFLTVSLDTPEQQTNGWTFQATIVHTAEGNIIRALPGVEVPPTHREGAQHCDHCGTNRMRRDTYIVRNEAGEVKQVGSTCLGEFLGYRTPALLCAALDCVFEAVEACENATHATSTGLSTFRIPTLRYLEFVAATIFKTGRYVTRKAAYEAKERGESLESTASLATYWMNHTSDAVLYPEPSDEAKALAAAAQAHVIDRFAPALPNGDSDAASLRDAILQQFTSRQDLSDFEHNLLTVARAQSIEPRLCGIAAYIIEVYRRSQPRHEAVQLNGGFQRIFDIFTTAAKALKFPAIQLTDGSGKPVRMTLAGAASKNAGFIYVKGGRGGDYYGKISPQGRFFSVPACPPSVEAHLKAFGDDPEAVAAKYGKLTGRCCFCGRSLCDDRSTDVGYGPVCASNFGLKWGSREGRAVETPATPAAVAA